MEHIDTLGWVGEVDGYVRMIDQTRLPVEFLQIDCRDVPSVVEAIKMLRVRGAPAIGIAAAYGVCVGMQSATDKDEAAFFAHLDQVVDVFYVCRPTALDLLSALERMKQKATGWLGRHRSEHA